MSTVEESSCDRDEFREWEESNCAGLCEKIEQIMKMKDLDVFSMFFYTIEADEIIYLIVYALFFVAAIARLIYCVFCRAGCCKKTKTKNVEAKKEEPLKIMEPPKVEQTSEPRWAKFCRPPEEAPKDQKMNELMMHYYEANNSKIEIKKDPTFNKRDLRTVVKHLELLKKRRTDEENDAKSSRFKKRGAIFIPHEVTDEDLAQKASSKIVKLKSVKYRPEHNEQFDIGSDVDDIELDTTTIESSVSAYKK